MIRIWDIPVRLFHWLLVLAVIGLFVTGKLGGNWMEYHQKLGAFVLGLVIFRVIWGVVGGFHARFANFVRGPSTVLAYMKRLVGKGDNKAAPTYPGHNPMGALSVVGLLAVLGFQAMSGLFADDDILSSGPYAASVSKGVSDLLTKLHKLNSDLILILVGVHIAAIVFYFFVKKENLVKAMFTGRKSSIDGVLGAEMAETSRPAWMSWLVAVFAAGVAYAVFTKAFA